MVEAADLSETDMAWATDLLAIEAVVMADPLKASVAVMTLEVARDLSNSSFFDTLFLTLTSNAEYLADLMVEIRLTAFQVCKQLLVVVGNVCAICLFSQRRISYHCTCHNIGVASI
jgi:hypothetical protein